MNKIIKILSLCTLCFSLLSCSGGNSGSTDSKEENADNYKQACTEGDFEKAHEILGSIHDEYLANNSLGFSSFDKISNKYLSALDYVYGHEIRELIANDEDCVTKIVFLLSEVPQDGAKSEGLMGYFESQVGESCGSESLTRYVYYCNAINKLCDTALNTAISLGNENLARALVEQYKENYEVVKGDEPAVEVDGVMVDGNHGYVKFTTKSKDAAKAKVEAKFGNAE